MANIDAHAHYEPRMLDLERIIAKMDESGIDKVVLIPAMNDPLPETPDALLAVLRGLMVKAPRAAEWLNKRYMTAGGDLKLRGDIYRIYTSPDNATVAEAIKAHPERFLGWIFVNPRAPGDPRDELETWRRQPGFVGVKVHPHWHGYAIEDLYPIAARCQELRLPMLIHLGFGEGGRWQLLSDRYPKLRMIFAHAGMPHFDRMWEHMKVNPNLRVDVSSPYLSERLVRRAVKAIGPHRALYGTDAPYGFHAADQSYDYDHIKSWVERLPCRAEGIDRILGSNVEELLADAR